MCLLHRENALALIFCNMHLYLLVEVVKPQVGPILCGLQGRHQNCHCNCGNLRGM